MKTEKLIDYIQFSTPEMVTMIDGNVEMTRSPNKFYKYCKRYEGGLLRMTGNPNSTKELIIMSGSTCEYYRSVLPNMIREEIASGAKVSRIDLCVNCSDVGTLDLFSDALTKRRIFSRRLDVEMSKKISGIDNGVETLYVGDMKKRGRKGIFRAYNKGLEAGLDIDLARFELECKGKIANNNARRWLEGQDIGAMIRASIDSSLQWWQEMMGNSETMKHVDTTKPEDFETDESRRWTWLFNQVAPALGKAIARDELSKYESGNVQRFEEEMLKAYNSERQMLIRLNNKNISDNKAD